MACKLSFIFIFFIFPELQDWSVLSMSVFLLNHSTQKALAESKIIFIILFQFSSDFEFFCHWFHPLEEILPYSWDSVISLKHFNHILKILRWCLANIFQASQLDIQSSIVLFSSLLTFNAQISNFFLIYMALLCLSFYSFDWNVLILVGYINIISNKLKIKICKRL